MSRARDLSAKRRRYTASQGIPAVAARCQVGHYDRAARHGNGVRTTKPGEYSSAHGGGAVERVIATRASQHIVATATANCVGKQISHQVVIARQAHKQGQQHVGNQVVLDASAAFSQLLLPLARSPA